MRKAMSLIELLVVISIIAVLASMLLSAIGMVRQSAQAVVCQNNQRQMAIAALGFANEKEGLLPGIGYDPNDYHWTIQIAPYLNAVYAWGSADNLNLRVYRCPTNTPKVWNTDWPVNYATTYNLSQFNSVPPWTSYWRDSVMPKEIHNYFPRRGASNWVLWGEASNSYGWWHCMATDWWNTNAFPHRGRASTMWLDSHVSSVSAKDYNDIAWNNYNVSVP